MTTDSQHTEQVRTQREIDEDSFTSTAEAIWRLNPHAKARYATPAVLREWMVERTQQCGPKTSGWGTLGFFVALWPEAAKAGVEGWFVNDH